MALPQTNIQGVPRSRSASRERGEDVLPSPAQGYVCPSGSGPVRGFCPLLRPLPRELQTPPAELDLPRVCLFKKRLLRSYHALGTVLCNKNPSRDDDCPPPSWVSPLVGLWGAGGPDGQQISKYTGRVRDRGGGRAAGWTGRPGDGVLEGAPRRRCCWSKGLRAARAASCGLCPAKASCPLRMFAE